MMHLPPASPQLPPSLPPASPQPLLTIITFSPASQPLHTLITSSPTPQLHYTLKISLRPLPSLSLCPIPSLFSCSVRPDKLHGAPLLASPFFTPRSDYNQHTTSLRWITHSTQKSENVQESRCTVYKVDFFFFLFFFSLSRFFLFPGRRLIMEQLSRSLR